MDIRHAADLGNRRVLHGSRSRERSRPHTHKLPLAHGGSATMEDNLLIAAYTLPISTRSALSAVLRRLGGRLRGLCHRAASSPDGTAWDPGMAEVAAAKLAARAPVPLHWPLLLRPSPGGSWLGNGSRATLARMAILGARLTHCPCGAVNHPLIVIGAGSSGARACKGTLKSCELQPPQPSSSRKGPWTGEQ